MPKLLYIKELKKHILDKPFSGQLRGLPGSEFKHNGSTVRIHGIAHTFIVKHSKKFLKAYEKSKEDADYVLLEYDADKLLKEKHVPGKKRKYRVRPLDPNGNPMFNFHFTKTELIAFKVALKTIGRLHPFFSRMGWKMLKSNVNPKYTGELVEMAGPHFLKQLDNMKKHEDKLGYCIAVARSADMAQTIDDVTKIDDRKKKTIIAVTGMMHEPMIKYFLKNPKHRERVLKEWMPFRSKE